VHSRLSPTPKIHCNFESKLTRLSILTQIIVNITILDAFLVATDILNFLEASTREHETKSSEHEVQASVFKWSEVMNY
jgi:hypothetical protein